MSNVSITLLSEMHEFLDSPDLLVNLLRRGFLASEGVLIQKDGVELKLDKFEYIPAEVWLNAKVDLELEQVATRDGSSIYQQVRILRNPLSGDLPTTRDPHYQYIYIDEAIAHVQSSKKLLRALGEGYPKAHGVDARSIDSPLGTRHELVPNKAFLTGQIDFMKSTVTYVPKSDFRRQPVTFHQVRIARQDFEEIFRPTVETNTAKKVTADRKYPWHEFWIEVFAVYVLADGWPKSKKEFTRIMAAWCAKLWTDPPDNRTIERELTKIYDRCAMR